jgi:hypothetical protein
MLEKQERKFLVLRWNYSGPWEEFEFGVSITEIRAYCREILKANLAGGELGLTVYSRISLGTRDDRLFEFGRVDHSDTAKYDDKLAQRILKGL